MRIPLPFIWRYKYRLKNDDNVYTKTIIAMTQTGADTKFYNYILESHLHADLINVELQ